MIEIQDVTKRFTTREGTFCALAAVRAFAGCFSVYTRKESRRGGSGAGPVIVFNICLTALAGSASAVAGAAACARNAWDRRSKRIRAFSSNGTDSIRARV